MRILWLCRSWIHSIVHRSRWEREMDDEVRFHIEQQIADLVRGGMTPREASRRARLEFGAIEARKDEMREAVGLRLLNEIGADLRYAFRQFGRSPAFTAVALLSLALGIGANTALFSAVNGLFLRKLSVLDPDALVRLKWAGKNDMVTDSSDYGSSGNDNILVVRTTFSHSMFRQFALDNRTMEDLFACAPLGRATVVVDGHADIATAFVSTGNYYRMLGLTANPGRTIVPDDDRSDATPVAVISARFWRTRFGNDPSAVGKIVLLNNVPVTIVGVITPALVDVQQAVREGPDIAVPLALVQQIANSPPPPGEPDVPLLERPTYWWLQIMGRVKRGVSAAQVQANLENIFQHTARTGLDAYLASVPADIRSDSMNRNRTEVPHLRVESGSHGIYDVNTNDSRAVTILSVVVVLMLSIVCVNVANLLLSRAAARQTEISVRLSLGATRARLVRQLLTESLMLAAFGGALGILVGQWGQQFLPMLAGQVAPLDWRVLAFVLAVTAVTGVVFGIAPALRAAGMNVGATLKDTSRTLAGSGSALNKTLLVLQVAVSLMLLIAAGLFLRTLQNLHKVDVGFNTRNLLLFRVSPMLNHYDEPRTFALYEQMTDRLRSIAGVRAVAISHVSLLSGGVSSTTIVIQGRTYAADEHPSINRLVVSPGFFETMEMPIRLGRGFTERDNANAPKVVVINETAARTYFPNVNPIGRHFGSRPETSAQFEVVGVLRDVKYNSVRDPAPPTMYVPYLQSSLPTAVFQVRTARDPASVVGAIREAVRKIDPNLPMMNVSTQVEEVERRLQSERVFAQAYTLFGGLALLLVAIGLFGLMSYSVARRTNEIGIRMALGAKSQDVLTLIMRESMTLVVIGIGIGLIAALAASRIVEALLFGVVATDALTMLGAVAVMVLVSGIAGYFPARRAARVDPLISLHYE
jgi:predicted permease